MRYALPLCALALAACRRPAPPAPPPRDVPWSPAPPATDGGRAVLGSVRVSPDGRAVLATAVLERAPETQAVARIDLRGASLRWAVPARAPLPDGGVARAHVAQSVRWSRDGARVIAHWASVGALGLLDASDGSVGARLAVPAFGPTVPFADGALAGDALGAQVLRLPDGREGARLVPAPAAVYFATVSADGSRAAVPGDDGLAVYDLDSGARLAALHAERASTRLSLSRDGSRVAEIRDGTLRVWSVGARPAAVYAAPAGDTPHVALSPDGARVAVCGDLRGGLVVHDLAARRAVVTDASLRCQGIDWTPDGAALAIGRYDGITLVRVPDGATLALSLTRPDGAWRVATDATEAQRDAFFAGR